VFGERFGRTAGTLKPMRGAPNSNKSRDVTRHLQQLSVVTAPMMLENLQSCRDAT
jgi:hypothetical protein